MAGNQTKSESTLIKKVGDIANVMAAAGVGFTDYITQLTYGNTAQKSRRDTARSDIIRPWINR